MSTVLVVDDQTSNRELVRDILIYRGHRVIEAREGVEALGLAHEQHPDLVLTDVLMPGMDGYQLAQELRAATDTAGTPIVFLTANYLPAEAAPFAQACGVARVLLKSIDPQALLQIIDEVLAEVPDLGPESAIDAAEATRAHLTAISAKLIERDAALTGAETRFRLMADRSPVGIVLGDQQGRADYVNDRFTAIMGVSAADLLGPGWLRCTGEEQHAEILAIVRGEVSGGVQHRYRGQVKLPTGRLSWLNVHIQAVDDDDDGGGQFNGFIASIDDVTAVVEAEQRHRAAERQHDIDARVQATQRLQSLSRLAGGVAHDFNNILGAMLGFETFLSEAVNELRDAGTIDDRTCGDLLRDLEQIRKGGQRATDLTQQLLTFGSRKVLHLAPMDLNRAVRESRELLARSFGTHIGIVLVQATDLPPILAEPINIGQILLNLTLNARDAMPSGGVLTVATSEFEVRGDQDGDGGTRPGRYLRLTVSDTGEGMAPDVLDRALEPFFTTRSGSQSSGLGLATVYGIVNQLGGTMQIKSTLGQGTVVTIDLPTTDLPLGPPPPPPEAAGGGTETVLVAEDEGPLRETVTRSLGKAGYTVLAAADGTAALAAAEQHAAPIDLLLSDVMMPGMLGHELAAHLRGIRPETRVLLMSGYAGGLMNDHGALPPGVTVLPKPFSENELLIAVRSSLGAPRR
ncbi:MAG TPA: response regulator [Catenuloplanes sp.]|jgi:PAS domain S-box-containing protein